MQIFIWASIDPFTVYYGNDTELGQQFSMSGDQTEHLKTHVDYTMYNLMLLKFTSNGRNPDKGFRILYETGNQIMF